MPKFITGESDTWTECVEKYGNALDKLALGILECHGKNHLACVALCEISENHFLIATNGFSPKLDLSNDYVRRQTRDPKAKIEYHTQSHLSSMHAEMKLLSVLLNDFGWTDDDFSHCSIGVSKPCCILCATVLKNFRVKFSMYHEQETFWLSPYPAHDVGCKMCEKDSQGEYHVILQYPKDFGGKVDFEKILAF